MIDLLGTRHNSSNDLKDFSGVFICPLNFKFLLTSEIKTQCTETWFFEKAFLISSPLIVVAYFISLTRLVKGLWYFVQLANIHVKYWEISFTAYY